MLDKHASAFAAADTCGTVLRITTGICAHWYGSPTEIICCSSRRSCGWLWLSRCCQMSCLHMQAVHLGPTLGCRSNNATVKAQKHDRRNHCDRRSTKLSRAPVLLSHRCWCASSDGTHLVELQFHHVYSRNMRALTSIFDYRERFQQHTSTSSR
jgi:hypothetical protein